MVRLVKPSPEQKLKDYLRRKYMRSKELNDRLTVDRDWRDGINAFRLETRDKLEEINETLKDIKLQLLHLDKVMDDDG